eukprot:scpid76722/ scgid33062/ 
MNALVPCIKSNEWHNFTAGTLHQGNAIAIAKVVIIEKAHNLYSAGLVLSPCTHTTLLFVTMSFSYPVAARSAYSVSILAFGNHKCNSKIQTGHKERSSYYTSSHTVIAGCSTVEQQYTLKTDSYGS